MTREKEGGGSQVREEKEGLLQHLQEEEDGVLQRLQEGEERLLQSLQEREGRLLQEGEDFYKKEGVVAAFKMELLEILCHSPGPQAKVLVGCNGEELTVTVALLVVSLS